MSRPARPRPIRVEGDVAFVPLTKGYEAIIDAADVPFVAGYCWSAKVYPRQVYAIRSARKPGGGQCLLPMHRVILVAADGLDVDHVDGNGLNNRRVNLREATRQQNSSNGRFRANNTSGFKGVVWSPKLEKWRAKITKAGRTVHLGYFLVREDAAEAYARASAVLHGEFGRAA